MWPWSVRGRAANQLEAEWKEFGMGNTARALAPALDLDASEVDFDAAASITGLNEAEVEIAWLRLRRRYIVLLRAHVRETVVSPADFDTEWKELFPD